MHNVSSYKPTIIEVNLEQTACLGFYHYRAGEPPVIGINKWVWAMRHNYNIAIRFFEKIHLELLIPGRTATLPTEFSITAVLTDEGIKAVLKSEVSDLANQNHGQNFSYSLN